MPDGAGIGLWSPADLMAFQFYMTLNVRMAKREKSDVAQWEWPRPTLLTPH